MIMSIGNRLVAGNCIIAHCGTPLVFADVCTVVLSGVNNRGT
jgi:hypothetical protein